MAGVIGLEDRQDSGYPLVEQDLYAVEEDADEGAFHHRLEGLQVRARAGITAQQWQLTCAVRS